MSGFDTNTEYVRKEKKAKVRYYARLLSFVIGVGAFTIILAFGYEMKIDLNPNYLLIVAGMIIGIAFIVAIVFSLIVQYLTRRELKQEEWDVSVD